MRNSTFCAVFASLFVAIFLLHLPSKAQVNPCVANSAFHIVVLGSSTAAGAGASTPDSAWVNRYRNFLQSINPAYQVTNRAVGGFTTYRIMPTGFTPPMGRPDPDTTHNITYAIGLNPDAIIVNLPSNDVSQGFSVQEQLDNFDTIVDHATAAGIPIWVCTTQPKNYGGNPVPIQKQQDVRDSIHARYSPRVLDFWTGLASPSNQLSPTYDSGDGTHLNDAGHGLVFTRARDANIPLALYQPPAYTDYLPYDLKPLLDIPCGDSLLPFQLSVYNRGLDPPGTNDIYVDLLVTNTTTTQSQTYSDTIVGGMLNCISDSLVFLVDVSDAGDYVFQGATFSFDDGQGNNDVVVEFGHYLGHPVIASSNDTGCVASSLILQAVAGPGDSLRWWDAASGGNMLAGGTQFVTPPLAASTTYYVEAARGDFVYRNSLNTTLNSNINWNGAMFDLVADSSLVIDSFGVKVNTTGAQVIEVYTRPGSHLGFETNAAAWTFRGAFPVNVTDPNALTVFSTGGFALNALDTLGVYFMLQNANSRLSYQSMGQPAIRGTDELTIITGSGASHNFGGNFYPRDLNTAVWYHFGSKPDGDCLSDRVPVTGFIGGPSVSLGNDTIINVTGSITLDAGAGHAGYSWSTGDMTQTILLDGNVLGTGIYTIVATVTDSLGCTDTDTIIVVFAPLVGNEDPATGIATWPNPARDLLHVRAAVGDWQGELRDLWGRTVRRFEVRGDATIPVHDLAAGMYMLHLRHGNDLWQQKIQVE